MKISYVRGALYALSISLIGYAAAMASLEYSKVYAEYVATPQNQFHANTNDSMKMIDTPYGAYYITKAALKVTHKNDTMPKQVNHSSKKMGKNPNCVITGLTVHGSDNRIRQAFLASASGSEANTGFQYVDGHRCYNQSDSATSSNDLGLAMA